MSANDEHNENDVQEMKEKNNMNDDMNDYYDEIEEKYLESTVIKCHTSKKEFTIKLFREWSPIGYDRAVELFQRHFYDKSHFFRVVPNFLVQFGISYTTDVELQKFADTTIKDDPQHDPKIKFDEGIISFAGSGPNSRTSHLFIAFGPVASLGTELWETPIGKVVNGMEYVKMFYGEYGDNGPKQYLLRQNGLKYVEENYPNLDFFLGCEILKPEEFDDNVVDDDDGNKMKAESNQEVGEKPVSDHDQNQIKPDSGLVQNKKNEIDAMTGKTSLRRAKGLVEKARNNIRMKREEGTFPVSIIAITGILMLLWILRVWKSRTKQKSGKNS